MGILQKIFDKSAESMNRNWDKIGDDLTEKEALLKHPVTSLKMAFAGLTCTAAVFTAKVTKRDIDTSGAGFSGPGF